MGRYPEALQLYWGEQPRLPLAGARPRPSTSGLGALPLHLRPHPETIQKHAPPSFTPTSLHLQIFKQHKRRIHLWREAGKPGPVCTAGRGLLGAPRPSCLSPPHTCHLLTPRYSHAARLGPCQAPKRLAPPPCLPTLCCVHAL